MKKNYEWDALIPEQTNIDISGLKNFERCVNVLCNEWQMDRTLAEAEIKLSYASYLQFKDVIDKSQTNLTLEELSALHDLVRRLEANELSDIKIVLKAKGLKKPVTITSQYLLNSFTEHIKALPGATIPYKPSGRPKGPEDPTLLQSLIAIKLNERYKDLIKPVKERYIYIGVVLFAMNAITGYYIDDNGKLTNPTPLYDRVKVLFKL